MSVTFYGKTAGLIFIEIDVLSYKVCDFPEQHGIILYIQLYPFIFVYINLY